jgi:predicted TIM-barrel fold metal-dependent hydrolase
VKTIAVEEHFRSRAYLEALQEGRLGTTSEPSATIARLTDQLLDLGAGRLADMDAARIDLQVISHNAPGPEVLSASEAPALARAMNDELVAAVRLHPGRFAGLAMLPMPAPDAAAVELRRALDAGLRGAMVHGTTAGRFLDDPFFSPLLAEAERLGAPLFLHPTRPPAAVLEAYYSGLPPEVGYALATSAWGWHVETGLHALRLAVGGAFDRFPALQVVIGHMGEAIPFMLERTASVLRRFARLDRPLRDYFTQNVHYATSSLLSEAPFRCLLELAPPDRILFAVDYPFTGNEQGRRFLDGLQLPAADLERIAHGNAERLFRLG